MQAQQYLAQFQQRASMMQQQSQQSQQQLMACQQELRLRQDQLQKAQQTIVTVEAAKREVESKLAAQEMKEADTQRGIERERAETAKLRAVVDENVKISTAKACPEGALHRRF